LKIIDGIKNCENIFGKEQKRGEQMTGFDCGQIPYSPVVRSNFALLIESEWWLPGNFVLFSLAKNLKV
jgi:hypothetical protein